MQKIIRSSCLFTKNVDSNYIKQQQARIQTKLLQAGYQIQTQRACFSNSTIQEVEKAFGTAAKDYILSIGSKNRLEAKEQINSFIDSPYDIAFNLQVEDEVQAADVDFLMTIIKEAPSKTFHFTYSFSNVTGSPFFPAANYGQEGYSLGLQPTNLAAGCTSLAQWFEQLSIVWSELMDLFGDDPLFLGIDSSIAPLFDQESSFIHFIQQLTGDFDQACTSDIFTQVSNFIKQKNPKPTGLCGLMFPCLEDFELTKLYEAGAFGIERNIFLSLHSGLGIDTYPIGIDEDPKRVQQILQLLLALAKKYNKPLAARFVSDGSAKIGMQSNFKNQYLKDTLIRKL